jgi:hypothetical protein
MSSAERIETFPAKDVQALLESARQVACPAEEGAPGWSVSSVDPMRLVAVFAPALRVRDGYTLCAYQFRDRSGNGNGVVYALRRFDTRRARRIG